MRALVFAVLLVQGCAHSAGPVGPADDALETPPDSTRQYTIWLGGSRIGTATERETWTRLGMTLVRTEQLRFLRGASPVTLTTQIIVDATPALSAQRVRWTETGTETRAAEAHRRDDGWQLSTGQRLSMPAVPAELVPLFVRRDGHFAGPVFLPARGFVTGLGDIAPVASDRLVARISLDHGPVALATIDLDRDHMPARVVDGEGVIAIRATSEQAAEPFAAVDLIAATALPITGAHHGNRLVLAGDVVLPALPGQTARPSADGIEVDLEPGDGSAPAAIRDALRTVQQRITPSLTAGPISSRDAETATSGDCTTFALAYAALATSKGIPTKVVTGLRIDGDRLIRHRWAVSWTGDRWIAIDAAFGHANAGGNLVGLAVHDADDAGLVAGEAALTQVHAAHWAP